MLIKIKNTKERNNMSSEINKTVWKDYQKDVLQKQIYWICIAFIISLSYLFDLLNRTVGIDDLAREKYFSNEHISLSTLRWGGTLFCRLFSDVKYTPFIDKFVSIIFFIIGSVIYSGILYRYIQKNKYRLFFCILLSCLYISYPIVNEIWNYNGINYVWTGGAAAVAYVVFALTGNRKIFCRKTLICSLLLSVAISSYEASAFLYVTVVLGVILLDSVFISTKEWFTKGLYFAIPLIIAFLLRYAIGFSLVHLFHLSYYQNQTSGINWQLNHFVTQLNELIFDTFINYGLKALLYQPIAIFIYALVSTLSLIVCLSIKTKKPLFLFLYLVLVLSLFAQSFVQGFVLPYRTALTLQFFCPFTLTLGVFAISLAGIQILFRLYCVFLCFICYRQGVFLNKTFALNNQRSDNEAAIAYHIGFQLKQFDTSKPVYFVGEINVGEFINNQTHPDPSTLGGYLYKKIAVDYGLQGKIYNYMRIYDTNNNSIINWNRRAFNDQSMMYSYLSYYGFDITSSETMDFREHDYYLQQAVDVGMEPFSVRDMGDYILVYLDEETQEYRKNP